MTVNCGAIPLECRTVESFCWISLLISICINFSQCAYIHSLRIKYRTLEERNLEQLLEDVSGEIPEATIVPEE